MWVNKESKLKFYNFNQYLQLLNIIIEIDVKNRQKNQE